jgi:hypothetical protein
VARSGPQNLSGPPFFGAKSQARVPIRPKPSEGSDCGDGAKNRLLVVAASFLHQTSQQRTRHILENTAREEQDIMHGISTLNLNKITRPGLERAPTSTNLSRPLPIHRLEGKVALITGGGGKIGVETAGRLLIEGANVALIDIDQPALEAAVPVLKAAIPTGVPLESRLLTIAADATIESDVEACVKKTVQRFGKLDCALLNASVRDASTSLFETKAEDWDRIMNTNTRSGMTPFVISNHNIFADEILKSFPRRQACRHRPPRTKPRRLYHSSL